MKNIILLLVIVSMLNSCSSGQLKEPMRSDYTTSGILADDYFQAIITYPPDKEFKTMAGQRENSFIKAKNNLIAETEKQILLYYISQKKININDIQTETMSRLKEKFMEYAKDGNIDQEYYLPDNSTVLVYRIHKTGIKQKILNN